MAIPGYQEFMYPFLKQLEDGKDYELQELYVKLANHFTLTPEEISQKLPSGKQTVLVNRIGWTRTYLYKAGLIDVVRRAVFRITEEGLKVLKNPEITRIDRKFLTKYDNFNKFITSKSSEERVSDSIENVEQTPIELIELNFTLIRSEIKDALLTKILECSPFFFERLIVDLIIAMGYGGSASDAGQAIGKTGDEGIDGIIKEDVLGLDMIYLQAKRWKVESTVSRPDIQGFVGSLVGKKASKGIFITTAKFSEGARKYADSVDKRVILIDGNQLTDLMFAYNVGVSNEETYTIKKIDLDFFEE